MNVTTEMNKLISIYMRRKMAHFRLNIVLKTLHLFYHSIIALCMYTYGYNIVYKLNELVGKSQFLHNIIGAETLYRMANSMKNLAHIQRNKINYVENFRQSQRFSVDS